MAAPCNIRDPSTNTAARVTSLGQLVTAPLSFSTPVRRDLDAASTAFNFVPPSAGQQIIITDIIVSGAKSVSANDPAQVRVFTAPAAASTTEVETVLVLPASRGLTTPIVGVNFNVGGGVWLNATTDDPTVFLTIAYYYAPVEYP